MEKSLYQESRWLAYCRLMRLDRPIGTLLLLWPTLWALWLAARGIPDLTVLLVFIVGVVTMRSAGCVINDYADRHIDGYVARTAQRPLPGRQVNEREALTLFCALVAVAFLLVLTLNRLTIALSVVALLLAWIYPFMKRVTHLPQVVLGAAFGWAIPMAFAALNGSLPLTCWLLFLANLCWVVAYDTQYAMVDRDDDRRLGVKSTAILFGRYDNRMIVLLQAVMLILLIGVGRLNQLSGLYYAALIAAAGLFAYQYKLTAGRQRERCFQAFMNNNYVGLVLFIAIAGSFITAG